MNNISVWLDLSFYWLASTLFSVFVILKFFKWLRKYIDKSTRLEYSDSEPSCFPVCDCDPLCSDCSFAAEEAEIAVEIGVRGREAFGDN